ncbi:hypothetical protein AJ80_07618 [Polytolypa hystricis UAMH7299]|uniref:AMP-dependent synthetase/ligase domain-containing protein n=1 Tax=Polytolypa hystricis (strain UAMH7299) TaxID=1447883 RepID=A0A2B7XMT4_POLH7|nr:hypothetical protein AJ80_07618 [Polytolypa hystricis UAMH7299]
MTLTAAKMPAFDPKLSIVQGATRPELSRLTLGQLIDKQAERYGSKDAIIIGWSETRLSYRDLAERTKQLARALMALGIRKGDRVAILSGDDVRFVELFFAAARVGACLVIINKTYTVPECERALKHTEPHTLFLMDVVDRRSTKPLLEKLAKDRGNIKNVVLTRWDQLPGKPPATWDDVLSMADSVSPAALESLEKTVDIHSTANIQFTSGTTGSPKAAMLTHSNIGNNGFYIGDYLQLSPSDVVCCGPPLFHCFGLVAGLMSALTHGASIIFAQRDFDAPAVCGMLIRERATVLHGVPTMFTAVLNELERSGRKITTLRKGIAAGTKIPPALLTELERKLGYEHIAITYGMTETSPASFMTKVGDSTERKLETVGRIFPHATAKIVNTDNRIVPRGSRGEVCVAGWLVQQGYFRNPEKTAEVMIKDSDGILWMHTGDEGMIDDDGYLTITGRIKDMIIRGGENIYPLEIEERLLHHPAISGAAIVGCKDDRFGESVNAFLQIRPGQKKPSLGALVEWVRGALARHKAPVRVFWVGAGEPIKEYPVTGSGKIRKEILREIGNGLIIPSTSRTSKL